MATDWTKKRDGLEQRFRDRLARLAEEETRDERTHRLCILGGALEAWIEELPDFESLRLGRQIYKRVSPHHRPTVHAYLHRRKEQS